MKRKIFEMGVFVLLVGLGVATRVLPHEPNVTAVVAISLFAGFFMRRASFAIGVPLVSMLISDVVLGAYDYRTMALVYASLLAPIFYRAVLKKRLSLSTVGAGVLGSSTLFFVVTNFAVWLFSGMYSHDLAGLGECYVAAIPFFRNGLLGDLAWTAGLFGTYSLVTRGMKYFRPSLRAA